MTSVGAIDCGTHSIRLLIAEPDPVGGLLRDHVRRMEIVRLGQGVDRTGRLSAAGIERTAAALRSYAADLERFGVDQIRMVATSATRDAENAAEFQTTVRQIIGITPEVVTGEEEARLSFTGAVGDLPADLTGPVLVIDIGGGSTEFVVGQRMADRPDRRLGPAAEITGAVSVDIGCVRMTERHLAGDPPTGQEIAAATEEIAAQVTAAVAAVGARTARAVIGLAGSVTTVAGIALDLDRYQPERIHHARIGYPVIDKITKRLLGATRDERSAIPVMHPGRVDVIAAGALILRTILEEVGSDTLLASEHDILDGIAWSIV